MRRAGDGVGLASDLQWLFLIHEAWHLWRAMTNVNASTLGANLRGNQGGGTGWNRFCSNII